VAELPLAAFRARGGERADNPDGWGVAWREAGGLRLEKAPDPGCGSARFAALIETLISDLVVAHVRKARFPPVNTLANTHPFLRECCGRRWAFAHNGLVPEIVAVEASSASRVCQPEGETDSEFAFCHVLSHATRHFHGEGGPWPDTLASVSEAIAAHGKFNFLLTDGEHLIAYGHDRLHCLEGDGGVLVATEPLDDRPWVLLARGELRIWRHGERVQRRLTHPPLPQ
jgi:glutamine amidotransferase